MTLKVASNQVNSVQGVPISVTGIAQVLMIYPDLTLKREWKEEMK